MDAQRVCHALHSNGLSCITRQGCITRQWFVMHYTTRGCHALHGNGLSCITWQGFVMHCTRRVCHFLPVKGLPRMTRQVFVMHYTTKVYITDQQFLYSTDSALSVAWVCSDTYRLGSVVGAGVVGSGVVVGASEVLKGVVVGDWDSTVVAVRSQDTSKRRAIFLRNLRILQHLLLDQNMDRHGPEPCPRHLALPATFRMSWHTVGPRYTSLVINLDSACTASSSLEPSSELLYVGGLTALAAL